MADTVINTATSLLLLSFFLLQCLTNASSVSNGMDNHATSGSEALEATISGGRGPWCLAKPGTTEEALQKNIQYVCGGGIVDCSAIQEGGFCYYPNNAMWHAYYAMNAYYFAADHKDINCYFNGTALVVYNDPSYDNCLYPS